MVATESALGWKRTTYSPRKPFTVLTRSWERPRRWNAGREAGLTMAVARPTARRSRAYRASRLSERHRPRHQEVTTLQLLLDSFARIESEGARRTARQSMPACISGVYVADTSDARHRGERRLQSRLAVQQPLHERPAAPARPVPTTRSEPCQAARYSQIGEHCRVIAVDQGGQLAGRIDRQDTRTPAAAQPQARCS